MNKFISSLHLKLVGVWWVSVLVACDGNSSPPPQAEKVRISAYHPWPPSYVFKTVGDWALLENGALIQIESTKLTALTGRTALPVPESLIVRDPSQWDKASRDTPSSSGIVGDFDGAVGLICVESVCARVHAICPSMAAMRRGEKCSTFEVN